MTDKLKFDVDEHVATITLNNPDRLNAFDPDMLRAWHDRLEECRTDENVRVIVVTGAGRGFCSGGDTRAMGDSQSPTPKEVKDNLTGLIQRIPLKLQEIDKPVIAAINGAAVGAGLDMALHCDLRYAAEGAKMSETYVRMGLVPGNGAAWFLPRIVGTSKALELLWTAEFLTARQALEIGLVNGVFPDDELMDRVYAVAGRIARSAPISVQYIKRLVYQGQGVDLRTHFDTVSSHMTVARSSADHVEAIDAYRNKREPRFEGR